MKTILWLALAVVMLSACMPEWMESAVLTADGSDIYNASGQLDAFTVSAPAANTGANLRLALFHEAAATDSGDQRSCATWTAESHDRDQQGAMVRWDGLHGVTATKNVWGGSPWVINVHVWDPSAAQPFTWVYSWDMPALHDAPLPWRMCVAAVADQVQVKVWPLATPEPDLGDPCCTGTATVAAMPERGRPGWYVGHLPPGGSVDFADASVEAW